MRRVMEIFLWLFLVLPLPAFAAMTLGGAVVNNADSTGTNVLTYNGLTAGRGIVALVLYHDAGTESIGSITVSGESNMTVIAGSKARNATSMWSAQLAYLGSLSSGGTKTITVTLAGPDASSSQVFLQELHDGSNGGIALDGSNGASGNSTTPSVSVTTGSANSALLAVESNGSSSLTAGTGFSILASQAWFTYEDTEYKLDAGASGPQTVNGAITSDQWVIGAAGFKPAAGGAPAETLFFRRRLQQ